MATFVILVNFTDQGIRNIRESPDRHDAIEALAESLGVKVADCYYTVGQYDMVVTVEGEDEAAVTTLLKVGSGGNVRTQTMRAFSVDEMREIIGNMP